jgi:hypothetical protein
MSHLTCRIAILCLLTLPGMAHAEEGDYFQTLLVDLDDDRIPDEVTFSRFATRPWHELKIRLSTEAKRERVYSRLIPNYLLRPTCKNGDTAALDSNKKTLEILTTIGDLDRGTCGELHEQLISIGFRGSELRVIGVEERFARPKSGDPGFDSKKRVTTGRKCPAPTLGQVEAGGLPECLKLGLFEQP